MAAILCPKLAEESLSGQRLKRTLSIKKVSLEGISTLIERATQLLPAIKGTELEKTWAGIRPQTGDGLPYFGEHPACKGLFIATGHYRNGILLSPITGVLIADILERKANLRMVPFSIGPFDTALFFLMEVDELELIINGEKIRIPAEESTVTGLLQHFNLHQKVVIVELNDEILAKESLSETLLSNGDKVEIVHFVGGG